MFTKTVIEASPKITEHNENRNLPVNTIPVISQFEFNERNTCELKQPKRL